MQFVVLSQKMCDLWLFVIILGNRKAILVKKKNTKKTEKKMKGEYKVNNEMACMSYNKAIVALNLSDLNRSSHDRLTEYIKPY